MSALRGSAARAAIAAAVVLALVAGAVVALRDEDRVVVTGEFTRAVGLFPGSDVRVLGVEVGEVLEVEPAGDVVRVTFELDADQRVPADAKAAIVAPSLVSDRYVQLFPAYTTGPTLRSGTVLGTDRTAVPVELDRISQSLDDLLVALGPKGANSEGALSRFLDTSARNLDGQGQNLHDLGRDLSLAVTTLSSGRSDFFGTVENLQTFTSMLAQNDKQVRRLNADLATVSGQLAGERDDLSEALENLGVALSEVSTFVRDNRALVRSNVDQLTSVTTAVARQRDALNETLVNAPTALSNLQLAYNPRAGTLDTRSNIEEAHDPALLLCALLGGGGEDQYCDDLQRLVSPTGATGGAGASALAPNLLPAVPEGKAVPAGSSRTSGSPTTGSPVTIRGADPTLGGLLETR